MNEVGMMILAAGVQGQRLRLELLLEPRAADESARLELVEQWIDRIKALPATVNLTIQAVGAAMGMQVTALRQPGPPLVPALWKKLLSETRVAEDRRFRVQSLAPDSLAKWYQQLREGSTAPDGTPLDSGDTLSVFPSVDYLADEASSIQKTLFIAERLEGLTLPGETAVAPGQELASVSDRISLAQRNPVLMRHLGLLWTFEIALPIAPATLGGPTLSSGEMIIEPPAIALPGLQFVAAEVTDPAARRAFLHLEAGAPRYFEVFPPVGGFYAGGFLQLQSTEPQPVPLFKVRQAQIDMLSRMAARADTRDPARTEQASGRIEEAVREAVSGGLALFRMPVRERTASQPPQHGLPSLLDDGDFNVNEGKTTGGEAMVQGFVVDVTDQDDDSSWQSLSRVKVDLALTAEETAAAIPVSLIGAPGGADIVIGRGLQATEGDLTMEVARSVGAPNNVLDLSGFVTAYWQDARGGQLLHFIVLRGPAGERLFQLTAGAVDSARPEKELLGVFRPGNWLRLRTERDQPKQVWFLQEGVAGFFGDVANNTASCQLALPWVGGVQKFRPVDVRLAPGTAPDVKLPERRYATAQGSWIFRGELRRPRPVRGILTQALVIPAQGAPPMKIGVETSALGVLELPLARGLFVSEPRSTTNQDVVVPAQTNIHLVYDSAGDIAVISPVSARAAITVRMTSPVPNLILEGLHGGFPVRIACGDQTIVWAAGARQQFVTPAQLQDWLSVDAPIEVEGRWLDRTNVRAERICPFPSDVLGYFDEARTTLLGGRPRLQYRLRKIDGSELWVRYDNVPERRLPDAPLAGFPFGVYFAIEARMDADGAFVQRMSRRPLALGGTIRAIERSDVEVLLDLEIAPGQGLVKVSLPWPKEAPPLGARVIACFVEGLGGGGAPKVKSLEVEFPILFCGEMGDEIATVYDAAGRARLLEIVQAPEVRVKLLADRERPTCVTFHTCRVLITDGATRPLRLFEDGEAAIQGVLRKDERRPAPPGGGISALLELTQHLDLVLPELGPNRGSVRIELSQLPDGIVYDQPVELANASMLFEAHEIVPWHPSEDLPMIGQLTAITTIPGVESHVMIALRRAVGHGQSGRLSPLETAVGLVPRDNLPYGVAPGAYGRYQPSPRSATGFGVGRFTVLANPGMRPAAPSRQAIYADTLFGWDGWNLSAPNPLAQVTTGSSPAPQVQPLPCKCLTANAEVPLRFGKKYRFRMRAVSLTGHAVRVSERTPTGAASSAAVFYRREPVNPPRVVHRAARTDENERADEHGRFVLVGDERREPKPVEVVLIPPAAQFDVLDRAGVFDVWEPRTRQRSEATCDEIVRLVEKREPHSGKSETPPELPSHWSDFTHAARPDQTGEFKFLPDPCAQKVELCLIPDPEFHPKLRPEEPVELILRPRDVQPSTDGSADNPDWPNGWLPVVEIHAGKPDSVPLARASGRRFVVSLPPGAEVIVKLRCVPHPDVSKEKFGMASVPRMLRIPVCAGGLFPEATVRFVHAVPKALQPPRIEYLRAASLPRASRTHVVVAARGRFHLQSTGVARLEAQQIRFADVVSEPLPTVPHELFRDYVREPVGLQGAGRRKVLGWDDWWQRVTEEKTATSSKTLPLPGAYRDHLRRLREHEKTFVPICEPAISGVGSDGRFLSGVISEPGGEYRRYRIRLAVKSRFATDYPNPEFLDGPNSRNPAGLEWIEVKSSRVPALPDVAYLLPLFHWGRKRRGDRQGWEIAMRTGVRIYLKRGWFSTGEGEKLGLAFPRQPGPGVPGTGWAKAPTRTPVTTVQPSLTAAALRVANPHATPAEISVGSRSFELVCFEPKFSPARGLWYVDLRLPPRVVHSVYVRLALCRYQPEAEPGFAASDVLQFDPMPLPPDRDVTSQSQGANQTITITGLLPPDVEKVRFRAELQSHLWGMPVDESCWGPATDLQVKAGQPGDFRSQGAAIVSKFSVWGPQHDAVSANQKRFQHVVRVQEIYPFDVPGDVPRVVFDVRVPITPLAVLSRVPQNL